MRLIDADALFNWGKHKLSDAVKYGNKDEEHQDFSYSTLMMYEIADEVDEAPTVDAVPVVRGEWVEAKSGVMSVWPPGQVMCSVCGQRMPIQWKNMPPHCYGCGAKMEG